MSKGLGRSDNDTKGAKSTKHTYFHNDNDDADDVAAADVRLVIYENIDCHKTVH
jgi:hypothetical protein